MCQLKVLSEKNWKTIFLLSIVVPVSLLVTFRLTGVLREPAMVSDTTRLEVVKWRSEAIIYVLNIGDCLESTYSNGEISTTQSLFIYDFIDQGLYFGSDEFDLAINVTAYTRKGHVHKMNVTVEEDYERSLIADFYWSSIAKCENLSVTKHADMMTGCGIKAFVEAVNVNHSSDVSLHYPFLWLLRSINTKNQTRLLEITLEILYYNGTVYKRVVQPFQLELLPDNNDSFESADEITAGNYGSDPRLFLGGDDTQDFYKIWLEKGDEISVQMTPPLQTNFDLYLYDVIHTLKASSTIPKTDAQESINFKVDLTGYWFIEVRHDAGLGFYNMSVSITHA